MDLISSIRQMMAEEHFSAAEEAAETALISATPGNRSEIIPLYLTALIQQKKYLPDHLASECLIALWDIDNELAVEIFEHTSDELKASSDFRILFFRMKLSEKRGRIQELHDLISSYHLKLFERSLPSIPEPIRALVQKYFRADFQLKIQSFALTLLRKDISGAESELKQLILDAFEKSSPKTLKEKLQSLSSVLALQTEKGHLEIFQSFLSLLVNGVTEKKDYKKLAEAVIYFDDFRFGVMLMSLFVSHKLDSIATDYAQELATHPQYDFVYVAKHFPDLKKYFVNMTQPIPREEIHESPDLTLEEDEDKSFVMSSMPQHSEDEGLLIHLVRNQNFSDESLLDLAVSFLQSELPRVAGSAAMIVHERATDDRIKLKAAYLALTALLHAGDYRKALDLALESMKLISSQDDLLSFLYCEAEAYLRLNRKTEARHVLRKIVSIDSRYRMARERLEKLG